MNHDSRAETHYVFNQPPPLVDHDPWAADTALREAVDREGGGWAEDELAAFSRRTASEEVLRWGDEANRFEPELRTHDRFGHRIDEVEFHPSWHHLMELGKENEVHSLAWSRQRAGAHVVRAAKHYLLAHAEAGVLCPLTMTFAAVPALRAEPEVAESWVPRLLTPHYDPRLLPPEEKSGCTLGMAMTEKQGGSDVRANTTRAVPIDGSDHEFRLTGHKWFCSAPMSDGFLTLAYPSTSNEPTSDEESRADGDEAAAGLTCFLVPRILDDGTRNVFRIQRLKRKLGNRSNASSEIEYRGTWARRIGPMGRGVPTIIEMVNHTRLDCVLGSAGLMRQALAQAIHHTRHRQAFGRRLAEQPLMRQVLADLALEVEAATALAFRLARAFDAEPSSSDGLRESAFRRVATAIGKYWVCKRGPSMVFEAMECLGGNGYVEESILPRLYREMPVNSIWEGSGNVMCLDVLRALQREPECADVFLAELESARGSDSTYDHELDRLRDELAKPSIAGARRLVEGLAVQLQASLLLRHAPSEVAEAFMVGRLRGRGRLFGTLPDPRAVDGLIVRTHAAS